MALNLGITYRCLLQHLLHVLFQELHTVDVTVEVYALSPKGRTIPAQRHEDAFLRCICDRVPVKLDQVDFEAPHFKTFLLLQAHFGLCRRDVVECLVERLWCHGFIAKMCPGYVGA